MIGFLGPKVYAALNGTEFPKGVQLAENLLEHGIVDAVVPSCELRPTVLRILEHLDGPLPSAGQARSSDPIANGPDAWECITTTRSPDRPGLRALLNRCSSAFVLGGPDRTLATDSTLLAIARVGGHACVVFGHDREAQQQGYPPGPTALRRAQRAMQLARDLRLPLVTVIDTSGTELSVDAEQHGTAREIANCLAAMATLDTPTVSVVLGQGCGGGALALLPADRTVAANHGWITPLPPEGASVILHGDPDLAPAVARQQRITAMDLCDNGIVDCLVDDSGSQAEFVARTLSSIEDQIQIVSSMGSDARRTARRRRWRIVTP
ncbi:carboxyl transferase domain-containing protein [Pimelobacter simplex]|uniref:carboxyl transferase domain-containing protein n=1 Tax=Nocardioides simplex TaxID=2045 RepID=UPI00214F653D|nr:carboxyl transferase domain-containing protein [Pimelobacter simplex]UUW92534.1 hypothetical protein M0M43_13925 [Pimelobacter simplex]UUW96362.1 hypothetical protein M0M48_02560 [Pimelobacter simplex]